MSNFITRFTFVRRRFNRFFTIIYRFYSRISDTFRCLSCQNCNTCFPIKTVIFADLKPLIKAKTKLSNKLLPAYTYLKYTKGNISHFYPYPSLPYAWPQFVLKCFFLNLYSNYVEYIFYHW